MSKEGQAHTQVWGHVRGLVNDQQHIHEMNLRHAVLYGNRGLIGGHSGGTFGQGRTAPRREVSENVIQSVIDTAASFIAKNQPRANFLTDGGEFSEQRKAKKLTKFVGGLFEKTKIYDKAPRVFVDACVFGTGVLKIFADHDEKKILIERVLPDEVIVDEFECRSAEPRQVHQYKSVNREVLKSMFPKFANQIESAQSDRKGISGRKTDPLIVDVIESWHLNSGPEATDGRHTIVIENATLFDEPWEKDHFPFLFYKWTDPLCGFYGQGLAEQIAGIQLRIHELNDFITKAQDLMARPKIMAPISAKISPQKFTNAIADIIYFRGGVPPIYMTPPAVSPEIYSYKEQLKRSAFEFAGITQLSASGLKPAGLESAVALREFNDIETQRFSIQAKKYEKLFLDAAKRIVGLAKEIHGSSGDFTSVFRARSFVQQINWSEVDMEEDRFVITIEASSLLSRTPAGRMQGVIELSQAGLIDTTEARRLLDHPDIERTTSLLNANIENIEAVIERLLDGEMVTPEPFQDLALGIRKVHMALLKAQDDGAPEEILELMRRWIEQANFELNGPPPEEQAPVDPTGQPLGAGGVPTPNTITAEQPIPAIAAAAAGPGNQNFGT